MFLAFGALFGVIGIAGWVGTARHRAQRRELLGAAACAIARLRMGELARVEGRVTPCSAGLVHAPVTGRPCVYARLVVEKSLARANTWEIVLDESHACDFCIDDGSGQAQVVAAGGATYRLERESVGELTADEALPAELGRHLAERGVDTRSWLGAPRGLRFSEEVLAADTPVEALARAHPPAHAGVRASFAGDEVIITTSSLARYAASLRFGSNLALVLLGLGAALLVTAGVMALS